MPINFTKMHGLGNDFIVIEALARPFEPDAAEIRRLADRHFGIGFDQLLVVEPPPTSDADFAYRIFNADGGEVEQCGNGARCFARYVYDRGLTEKTRIRVITRGGLIVPEIMPGGEVRVDMGRPDFEPARIPFTADARAVEYPLEVDGEQLRIGAVSLGNPHAVQVVADVASAPVTSQGPRIERHARFPRRVNAGYMQVLGRNEIRLRVWERGAGETLACGTGACAAVVVGIAQGRLERKVKVNLPGGTLHIDWPADDATVLMTGPVAYVFEGSTDI